MLEDIVGKSFQILCLVATSYLFIHDGLKYLKDEDSSLVEYRMFHDSKRDIYPSISICFYGLGVYDRKRLKETYEIEDAVEYMKFLNGDVWNATMVGVKYDDVTIDMKDYIESIIVMGMDWNPFDVFYNGYLYKWVNDNESTGEAVKSSHSSSNFMHNFPLRTTYRHAIGKCFSLDLLAETIPNIQGQLINSVLIEFKSIQISDVNMMYMISYPGQTLRGFVIDTEVFWNHRITSGYLRSKSFLLDIIEVYRKRSTVDKPCEENWMEDDNTIMRNIIKMAECKPPHWKISADYPICNTKEKMKNASIEVAYFKHASPKFLEKFKQPCHGILAATLNTLVEQRQNFSSLTSKDGEDLTTILFHFKNERYKEIKYTEAFDFRSVVSSVGGHIGLLLGFAFWQLPDAIKFLGNKLFMLVEGKIYHTYFFIGAL